MKIEYRHLNWMQLIWDTGMSYKAKLIASYLTSHMNREHHIAWPSVDRIADKTGLSKRTIERSIPELENAGWLQVSRGGINKGTSRYTPTFPEAVEKMLAETGHWRQSDETLASQSRQLASGSRQSLASESRPNQSNQSVNNNQRADAQFVQKDKKRKNPSQPNSDQRPASHRPFQEPAKLTKEQKQGVVADLEAKALQQTRNRIKQCRSAANLANLCRHYGWGEPPKGADMDAAKAWAIRKAEAGHA